MASGKYSDWLTKDGLLRIEGWARDGLTNEVIARKKIGINPDTLYRWKATYPEISEALKKGRAPSDVEVENALRDSAVGYWKTIREPIKVKTKRTLKDKGTIEEEHIEFIERDVYYPPNTTAMIFWLKNRRPDKWRDRQIETSTKDTDVEDLTALAELLNEPDTDN